MNSRESPLVACHGPEDVPIEGWGYWREASLLLRRVEGGPVLVGVAPFLFTWGVVRHVDAIGYRERWCFHDVNTAIAAATVLGVDDEPEGFIRKATG